MNDDTKPGMRAWLARHADAIIGITVCLALLLLLVLIAIDRGYL